MYSVKDETCMVQELRQPLHKIDKLNLMHLLYNPNIINFEKIVKTYLNMD